MKEAAKQRLYTAIIVAAIAMIFGGWYWFMRDPSAPNEFSCSRKSGDRTCSLYPSKCDQDEGCFHQVDVFCAWTVMFARKSEGTQREQFMCFPTAQECGEAASKTTSCLPYRPDTIPLYTARDVPTNEAR